MKLFQAVLAFLTVSFSAAFFAPVRPNVFVSHQRNSARSITPLRMDAGVADRVIEVVGEQLDRKGEVKLDSIFVDDLDADSLDTIELIIALEEEFKMDIPEDDATKMTCVKDAVEYIEKNM